MLGDIAPLCIADNVLYVLTRKHNCEELIFTRALCYTTRQHINGRPEDGFVKAKTCRLFEYIIK
jgi:hypothetical protein